MKRKNFVVNQSKQNRNYAEAVNTLGIIQFKRGQYAEAAENFRKTLELKPGYKEIYFNYSNALSLSGKPAEAEDQLKRAIIFMPPNANPQIWIESLNNLALCLRAGGKIRECGGKLFADFTDRAGKSRHSFKLCFDALSNKKI